MVISFFCAQFESSHESAGVQWQGTSKRMAALCVLCSTWAECLHGRHATVRAAGCMPISVRVISVRYCDTQRQSAQGRGQIREGKAGRTTMQGPRGTHGHDDLGTERGREQIFRATTKKMNFGTLP